MAYQNYDIKFRSNNYSGVGTLASFVGFNTYINSYKIQNESINVNDDKPQGYWGFETTIPIIGAYTLTGQAPAGATTVVNPLQSSSPIPAGSYVVTGFFINQAGNSSNLVITGNETQDIIITVSLSTNNSFEWLESNGDQIFDPSEGDVLVDMGIRGMKPIIE